MVKHALSIGLVGGVAAMTACFGEGPTPTGPADATILVTTAPGQNCNEGSYIGPVAFGPDHVYVSFLPYSPIGGSCSGGGGGGINAPQSVYRYPLAGGSLEKVGSAGETNAGAHVQLAATGSGVAYAFDDPSTGNIGLFVEPGHFNLPSTMGTQIPLGMFAVGSDVYVGTVNNTTSNGGNDVTNPTFPNGAGGGVSAMSGEIWHVGSGSAGAFVPECGSLDRCLVANSSSYTYVTQNTGGTGSPWSIVQVPLTGTTPTMIANAGNGGVAPLGLDVDDHQVAWSTTETCVQPMNGGSFNCSLKSCNVFVYDTSAAMPKPTVLLATQQFACVDAKLANGYVYFAIVAISNENNQMIGRGIGRVAIADRTVETLDLGIKTTGSGPHRIFPIGDQLYVVDPFVLARIAATALDGKHDFTP